jgi:ubiquinone/menaquinone biosynthesis C-methylase UbiE
VSNVTATETTGVAEGFSAGAPAYDDVVRHNIQGAVRLIASLPDGDYRDVLDVGCGTGFSAAAMIDRFSPTRMIGVDPSQGMLDVMREKLAAYPDVAVELHAAEVMEMPVAAASVDAVISSMAFHWFPDKAGAMREMGARLRPGGVIGILCSGRGGEIAFQNILRDMDPPVPPAWLTAWDVVQRDVDEMEAYIADAGLETVDIWMETRTRRTPVDAYLERIRVVAGHLSAGIPADELDALNARLYAATSAAAGPEGFEYTFAKLFAVARRAG